MGGYTYCTRKLLLFVLSILFLLECYLHMSFYFKAMHSSGERKVNHIKTNSSTLSGYTVQKASSFSNYYKYPLINSTKITMEYEKGYNSSYYWFISMKHLFKNLGDRDRKYPKGMPICQLNMSSLGLIKVNKSKLQLEWVEQQNQDVNLGGYYEPAHCRAIHRVAVFVPFRKRRTNLIIFLHYMHRLLKKQLLDYRIFVIEQYGRQKFNKGTLYNIAFLESQRFGTWHCLIFHDVDLIPEDERISYSCQEQPTHMAHAVEAFGYALPYTYIFGGVTALTPEQYESVNGYSNYYWNWGGEDDDFHKRLVAKKYNISRYDRSIARYAALPHKTNAFGKERKLFLLTSKLRFTKEGLSTTKYKLIRIARKKLYTHILADVNPTKMKLTSKSLMKRMLIFHLDKSIEYARQQLNLKPISAQDVMQKKSSL